jgi:hypothetical protein
MHLVSHFLCSEHCWNLFSGMLFTCVPECSMFEFPSAISWRKLLFGQSYHTWWRNMVFSKLSKNEIAKHASISISEIKKWTHARTRLFLFFWSQEYCSLSLEWHQTLTSKPAFLLEILARLHEAVCQCGPELCSPDLALCNFWWFQKLKNALKGDKISGHCWHLVTCENHPK